MGRVRVRRNTLPRIIARLEPAMGEAVQESARDLANDLELTVWRDTGVVASTADERPNGSMSAVVGVAGKAGASGSAGRGFYARFHEFGSSRQAARPIVGPTGHAYEPIFARTVGDAVEGACR